jgi:aspartate/methionine/tyrosine aminotransferase
MRIEPFRMERWQSVWENEVRYNLSESGVAPLSVSELLDPAELADVKLGYPPSRGSAGLRAHIAALYPGAGPEDVVVTVGTAEANLLAAAGLAEPGADFVMMLPNYMEMWGIARMTGMHVRPFHLRPRDGRWAPDLDELERAVGDRTRVIAVCNPNNPTGAVLTEPEMRAIVRIADRVGAWIIADEVYRGAELDGATSPSFHGMYERVLATCGLSKAYGLPGLRIGWVVGPQPVVEELWSVKDYTTLTPTALADRLATHVLRPDVQPRILERTRAILRERLPTLEKWVQQHANVLRMVPPQAGAIAVVEYDLPVAALELAERLRIEKSVLVVAAEHFGVEAPWIRIGFGYDAARLRDGLALVSALLDEIIAASPLPA